MENFTIFMEDSLIRCFLLDGNRHNENSSRHVE